MIYGILADIPGYTDIILLLVRAELVKFDPLQPRPTTVTITNLVLTPMINYRTVLLGKTCQVHVIYS